MDARSEATIHQAFSVGRVRFLITDTRSARSPRTVPAAERTMLGRDQLAWLLAELQKASDAPLVIWINTVPWITKRNEATIEGWAPYAVERRIIADAIKRHGLTRRLLMLSGDAHMLAIDDGTNSEYATGAASGDRGFVVAHAGPMDRYPRIKGGRYSHGQIAQNGQFGVLDVVDDGRSVQVTIQGHRGGGARLGHATPVHLRGGREPLKAEPARWAGPATALPGRGFALPGRAWTPTVQPRPGSGGTIERRQRLTTWGRPGFDGDAGSWSACRGFHLTLVNPRWNTT